jgi:hypothetical protein
MSSSIGQLIKSIWCSREFKFTIVHCNYNQLIFFNFFFLLFCFFLIILKSFAFFSNNYSNSTFFLLMSSNINIPCNSEFFCSACRKSFKKSSGLSRHLAIVNKYNIPRNDLDSLSETNNKKFKNILVYLIHRKLPNGFRKGGRQLVLLACTEHQFFDIFKGYIHYRSNKNVYKCIF